MIIWIASYPKSGNTYLRSVLSAYYFSNDGKFNFDLLKNINQFPDKKFSKSSFPNPKEASVNWINAQDKIISDKKIKFLKTHNCLAVVEGNKFTTPNHTLGVIYIVRDPRNIITSLKNHYSYDYKKSLKMMSNDQEFLFDKDSENNYSAFTFLSSWSNHYKSWVKSNIYKTMVIKFEDLEKNKFEKFKKLIIFVNKISNKKDNVDENKLYKCIKTTEFINLKRKEEKEGFFEAAVSKKDGKKLPFFNLGFKNKWEKILPIDIKNKINYLFNEDLEFWGYK